MILIFLHFCILENLDLNLSSIAYLSTFVYLIRNFLLSNFFRCSRGGFDWSYWGIKLCAGWVNVFKFYFIHFLSNLILALHYKLFLRLQTPTVYRYVWWSIELMFVYPENWVNNKEVHKVKGVLSITLDWGHKNGSVQNMQLTVLITANCFSGFFHYH